MSSLKEATEQDLGLAEPTRPDVNWPAHTKPQFLAVDENRLNTSHQLVKMRNNHPEQVHIIVDRFLRGHELMPGQTKEIDMIDADIRFFQRQRRTDRTGSDGRPLPVHPVEIVGIREAPEDEVIVQHEDRQARSQAAAAERAHRK